MTYNFFDKATRYSGIKNPEYTELLIKIEKAEHDLQSLKEFIISNEKRAEEMNDFARKQELLCKELQQKIKDPSAPKSISFELEERTKRLQEYKKVIEKNQRVIHDHHIKYEALKNTLDCEKNNLNTRLEHPPFEIVSQTGA